MMRWIHLEAGLLESVAEFSGVAGPPLFLVVGGGREACSAHPSTFVYLSLSVSTREKRQLVLLGAP